MKCLPGELEYWYENDVRKFAYVMFCCTWLSLTVKKIKIGFEYIIPINEEQECHMYIHHVQCLRLYFPKLPIWMRYLVKDWLYKKRYEV